MKKIISLLVIPLIIMACNQKANHNHAHNHCHGHGHNHNHGHESHAHNGKDAHAEESIKYTLFNKDYELFVELNEPVVGESITLLAHYTQLDNYKPLAKAEVFVEAHKDGKLLYKSKTFKQLKPGIYEGKFFIKQEGDFDFVFVLQQGQKVSKHKKTAIVIHDHPHGAKHAHSHEENITFLKEQSWDVDFALYKVVPKEFNYSIKTSGEILPARGNFQIVTAKSSGIIKFAKANMDNGTQVGKGNILFIISGDGLSENNIENKYAELKSEYEKSKSNYERKSILFKEKIVAARTYEQSKAQYKSDSSKYYNLLKKYSKSGIDLKASISGNIYNLTVNNGDYVEEGQEVARIIASNKLRIQANVPQTYFDLLDDIYSLNFKTAYSKKVYSLEDLNGKLISKGAYAKQNGGFVPIIFEVENKDLIAGSFVECWLQTKKLHNQIVIPKSALIEEQDNYYVYVMHDGESYEKRFVKYKAADGKQILITEGVKIGERVVSKGAIFIKVASIAGNMPVHSH
jgi:RND family efflux transporter MFP subunit